MTAWAYTIDADRAFIATDSAVSTKDRYWHDVTKIVYAPHLHVVSAVRGSLMLARRWHGGLLATAQPLAEVIACAADTLRELEARETENYARVGLAAPSCSVLLLYFTAGRAQGVVHHSTEDTYTAQPIQEGHVFAIPSPLTCPGVRPDAPAAAPAPSTPAAAVPWSIRTGTCLQAIRDVARENPHAVSGEIVACEFTEFAAHFFRAGPCDG